MKVYIIILFLLITHNCFAQELSRSVKTSRGLVAFEKDDVSNTTRILLDNKLLWIMDHYDGYDMSNYYKVNDEDVIIMYEPNGNTATYFSILVLYSDGDYKISQNFGNSHGNPNVKATANKIEIKFPAVKTNNINIKSEVVTYTNKSTLYNGKPLAYQYVGNYIKQSKNDSLITPFGDIRWDDNVIELVNKLTKIQGISNIKYSTNNVFNEDNNTISIEDVKTSQTFIDFINNNYSNNSDKKLYEVINKDGSIKYNSNNIKPKIVADHIYISGIPFELTIYLTYNPGIILRKDNNIISDDYSYIFPYTVTEVSLESAPNQNNSDINKIINIIVSKYNKFSCVSNTANKILLGECYDSKLSHIKYLFSESAASLEYHNESYIYLDTLEYISNVNALKKKEIEKIPDMGSGI